MPDDYGYFGKGQTGYTHYMQAFQRNNSGGNKPPSGKGGCLTCLSVVLLCITIFVFLLS